MPLDALPEPRKVMSDAPFTAFGTNAPTEYFPSIVTTAGFCVVQFAKDAAVFAPFG